MFSFTCPHCQEVLEQEEDYTGSKVRCYACGEKFIVAIDNDCAPEPALPQTPAVRSRPRPKRRSGQRATSRSLPERTRRPSRKPVQAPKKPPAKRPKFIWVALGVCCIGIAAMVISSSKTNTSARSTSALSKSAGDPKKTAMVGTRSCRERCRGRTFYPSAGRANLGRKPSIYLQGKARGLEARDEASEYTAVRPAGL